LGSRKKARSVMRMRARKVAIVESIRGDASRHRFGSKGQPREQKTARQ